MATKRYRLARLEHLRKNNFSAKNIRPETFAKLRASILKSGILQGLVVRQVPKDKCWEIIKGNTVYDICKAEGIEEVLITDVGPVSREEAMKMYLQMTSTHQINYVKVGQILSEIKDKIPLNELEKVIPHNLQEITELVKLLEFDWAKFEPPKEEEVQTSLFS